jgi:peptidoglycan/LPS O-acetylase OafA/YrhL
MDFRALPPEINSARMYTRPESGPDVGRLAASMSTPFTPLAPTTNAAGLTGQAAAVSAAATTLAGHASTEADSNPPENRERQRSGKADLRRRGLDGLALERRGGQGMLDRRSDIQGLRAIAILLVVAYHSGLPVAGGFVGVDVFFVISGFVITRLLWAEIRSSGRIDLRRFYARRIRRLLPALTILILVVTIASMPIENPLGSIQVAARTAAVAALFVANGALFLEPTGYFAAPAALNPFLHTWSLAVEEQFYLIFPAILILAGWLTSRLRGGRRDWTIGLLLGLSALSCGLAMFLSLTSGPPFHHHNVAFSFYSSPTRAWEFGVGALIAIVESRIARRRLPVAVVAASLGAAALIGGVCIIDPSQPFPGPTALLPIGGTGLLIAAGSVPGRHPVGYFLSTAPMQWVGDLSYSWYLWHWPVIVLARDLAPPGQSWIPMFAAVASLAPAWLSKRYVEDPIRNRQRFGRIRALGIAAACVALAVTVAGSAFLAAYVAVPAVREARSQLREHLEVGRKCVYNLPADAVTTARCAWPSESEINSKAIVLIGDSNAGQFAEAMIPAAAKVEHPLILATSPGCPFVDIELEALPPPPATPASCHNFVKVWRDEILAIRPSLIVMASASSDYVDQFHDLHHRFRAPGDDRWFGDDDNKGRLWQTGVASLLKPFSQAKIPVLLIRTLPHFANWNLYRCLGTTVWTDVPDCGRVVPLAQIRRQQQLATQAEDRAATDLSQVTTVDLKPRLCPDEMCRTNVGPRWINRDSGHITVGEAELLEPAFEQLVASHVRQTS